MNNIFKDDEEINPYFDKIALDSPVVEEHRNLLGRLFTKAGEANRKFN